MQRRIHYPEVISKEKDEEGKEKLLQQQLLKETNLRRLQI